ncbi:MAG: DUF2232 domain-containing protein [Pseudobdellovibrionaceae bacterium]
MSTAEFSTQRKSGYFFLISASFVLSVLTLVMSALPLKALRSSFGFIVFALTGLVLTIGFWLMGFKLLAVFLVGVFFSVGVFSELENRFGKAQSNASLFWAGLLSAIVGSGVFWGALELWMKSEGWSLKSKIHEQLSLLLAQAASFNPKMSEITTEMLLAQAPSVVISVFTITLALAVIYERRVLSALKLSRRFAYGSYRPREFRVPDVFVWASMVAFLLSFKSFGLSEAELVAVNVLNVMVILYLFQGVAVAEAVFHHFRVGPFFRVLFFLILVLQLFFVLSAVGFADFWLDIRKRLKNTKQPAGQN